MTPRENILVALSELEAALNATGYSIPALVVVVDPIPGKDGSHATLNLLCNLGTPNNLSAMRTCSSRLLDDLENGTLPANTERS